MVENIKLMYKKYFYILLFVIPVFNTNAQDISFTASAPKYVKVGEQFQLQFSVNKDVNEFTPPDFTGFDYLGGPMQSVSSSQRYENGKFTKSVNYTYVYVLSAQNPGKYTIKPATVKYKRDEYKSNAVEIEVVGQGGQTTVKSSGTTKNNNKTPAAANNSGEEIFVRLVLDKKSAYVGEQITGWVKIFTKINISNLGNGYTGPDFQGFFKEEIEVPPLRNLEREKVGNEIYHSGVIQKFILYPQKSGKLVINPFDLSVQIQQQVRKQARSIFDEFFGSSYTTKKLNLKSKPVIVNVKPLPANKPAGFTGAVGNYNLKGSVSESNVKINDAVSFKITLSGTGNIKLIENIDYELPPTLEVYDPIVKQNIDKSGKRGTKTFEITAIPRHSGTIDIKPFKLVYFDPVAKKYRTIQTQSFMLDVEQGEGDSTSVIISNLSKEEVEMLGSDIRYIHTETKLKPASTYLIDKVLFYLLYILILLIFIFIVILNRELIKRRADIAKTKHKKAGKVARKRLLRAHKFVKQNNANEFYDELSKALWGYISDKLNIPISVLSSENARENFEAKGVDSPLINEILEVITSCEFARYAPGKQEKSLKEIYDRAMHLILQIEQKI